ncbi:MAG: protein kinase [Nitrospira sp.]|nr:protein kinase [Nitrospira sp.]
MSTGRWEIVKEIGKGGQGTTYLAKDTMVFYGIRDVIAKTLDRYTQLRNKEDAEAIAYAIEDHFRAINGIGMGALKILHDPLKHDGKALERLKNEVNVLSKQLHPSIIKILDAAPHQGWFTTTFYSQGTLADNLYRFKGQPLAAMQALRPIVEAVAVLHRHDLIHRDIKPANIFFSDGGLVLGDFGLVFFADEQRTRISDTYENVGSRDWMPPWAFGKQVEELSPTFDVFSLAKVLWAMISGKTVLPLWYHTRPENNISELFPRQPHMELVNQFLNMCIQENEEDMHCLDASMVLQLIDQLIQVMKNGGDLLRKGLRRICMVCGDGTYQVVVDDKDQLRMREYMGFSPVSGKRWRLLRCGGCGHIQFFELGAEALAWGPEDWNR